MGRYLFQVSSPNGSNSSIISSRGHNWRRRPTSSILNASPGIPSTPSFHSSPPLLPSSVGLRRRTGLPVYNDSLPSESQPQTSIELSRHRLPFNQLSMTWTAPQPRSRRSWFLPPTSPTHRSQRRATPTAMLGIGTPIQLLPNERDQENAAMYAEWERRQLAAAERRQAIRRGGDVLEGTPPRDPDISF